MTEVCQTSGPSTTQGHEEGQRYDEEGERHDNNKP